jgi:hypothetical protein
MWTNGTQFSMGFVQTCAKCGQNIKGLNKKSLPNISGEAKELLFCEWMK